MNEVVANAVSTVREKLFGDSRTTAIQYNPQAKRENQRPKFRMTKKMNDQGQVYIPVDVREDERRSDTEEGDSLSLDVFAPDYYDSQMRVSKRAVCVDVNVTSGYRITIPADVRDNLNLQAGDKIAIHAYWKPDTEE